MRKIGIEDIDDIALGSSLLGSGGGGDPYMGRLEAIAAVKKYGPVELLDIDEVPDTWTVAPICGVGAPSVSLEKGTNGVEYPKVRAMMERMLGRKLDAFLLSEAGGMNSMVPISAAARAGLPLINADGMGRAFPGIQQDTFTLNGVSTNPFIIADEKGNCTVLTTINNDWTEEIGREITTACGGQVTTLASPMSGEKMKTSVVVGTVDYAQKLGRIIRTATDADNPERLIELGGVRILMMHGHTRGVKSSAMNACYAARECGAQILLFGHTHRPLVDWDGTLWVMNPGSIRDRRTYGVITLEGGKIDCAAQTLTL